MATGRFEQLQTTAGRRGSIRRCLHAWATPANPNSCVRLASRTQSPSPPDAHRPATAIAAAAPPRVVTGGARDRIALRRRLGADLPQHVHLLLAGPTALHSALHSALQCITWCITWRITWLHHMVPPSTRVTSYSQSTPDASESTYDRITRETAFNVIDAISADLTKLPPPLGRPTPLAFVSCAEVRDRGTCTARWHMHGKCAWHVGTCTAHARYVHGTRYNAAAALLLSCHSMHPPCNPMHPPCNPSTHPAAPRTQAGWPDVQFGDRVEAAAPEWLVRYLAAKRAVEARLGSSWVEGSRRRRWGQIDRWVRTYVSGWVGAEVARGRGGRGARWW